MMSCGGFSCLSLSCFVGLYRVVSRFVLQIFLYALHYRVHVLMYFKFMIVSHYQINHGMGTGFIHVGFQKQSVNPSHTSISSIYVDSKDNYIYDRWVQRKPRHLQDRWRTIDVSTIFHLNLYVMPVRARMCVEICSEHFL